MYLSNDEIAIEIIIDHTNTLNSTDNKPYDLLLNPEKINYNSMNKALSFEVNDGLRNKRIIVFASYFVSEHGCAIIDGTYMIILLNTFIFKLNYITLEIALGNYFSDFGYYFEVFSFDNGYLIYGELGIVKLDRYFNVEWSFSWADIFVTFDGTKPFEIIEDVIYLTNWEGRKYIVKKYHRINEDDK